MNQEIKQISNYLEKNKDSCYFSIKYGNTNFLDDILFEPISDKNKGAKVFETAIKELAGLNPEYIIIEVYKKAAKNFKKKPEFIRKVVVKRTVLDGFSGLEMFGGLNGVIETKTNLSILKSEKDRLQYEVETMRTTLESVNSKNNRLEQQNKDLQEQIRDLKYDNKDLIRKNESEIQDISKKNQQIDRFITLGGTILANVAGIDEQSIKGLLGLDEMENKQIENSNTEKSEVVFVSETKEKQKSHEIAKQIFEALNKIIDDNDDTEALTLVSKIGQIYNFLIQDIENLNNIYDLTIGNETKKY